MDTLMRATQDVLGTHQHAHGTRHGHVAWTPILYAHAWAGRARQDGWGAFTRDIYNLALSQLPERDLLAWARTPLRRYAGRGNARTHFACASPSISCSFA